MTSWANLSKGSSNNTTFKKQQSIINVELSRIFIKKVFKHENKINILLQVGDDIGVFLDARFVKTDEYSLNANIGVCEDFEYSIVKLNEKSSDKLRVTGKKLLEIIMEFKKIIEN